MKHVRDIRKLRQYLLFGQAASLLIFLAGILSICLFFNPEIVGIPQQEYGYYRGQWTWLCIGTIFPVLGVFWIVISEKNYHRLVWIFNNVQPEPMSLSLSIEKWTDSNDYTAILSRDEISIWNVSLSPPFWQAKSLTDRQILVQVYFDPKTNYPAIIETEFGLFFVQVTSQL
jgi:hypothetical protein